MTGVILQARLGSTRLPGKALLDLSGRPVVEHAMRALLGVEAQAHVVATDLHSATTLQSIAASVGFAVFVGHPTDLLQRYVTAAQEHGITRIVRATGDNPLVSAELANLLLAERCLSEADFAAYDGPPLGTGVEVVRTAALLRALDAGPGDYEREHATPYLYHHPNEFVIRRIAAPAQYTLAKASVTLDTLEEYLRLQQIFSDLYRDSPIEIGELIEHLGAKDADASGS